MVSVPNSTNINPFNYTNTANLIADNYISTNNLNSNQLFDLQGNKYQNQHYLNQNNSTWSNSSNQFKAQLNTYYKNDISNSTQSNKPLNYHFEIGAQYNINQNDQYLNKTGWNESFTKFNYEIQLAAKPAVKKGTIDYSSYDLNSGKIALKQDGQKNFKRNSHISKLSNSKKTRTKDKYRVVYNETQRFELESEFFKSKYITSRRKTELASFLDLSQRQIKIWFQNRRAKDRKISKKKRNEVTTSYSDNSSKNSSLSDSDLNMNHANLYNNPEYNTNWQQHGQFSNNINIQKVEMLTQPTNLHISSTVNDYKFNPISDDYNKNWF